MKSWRSITLANVEMTVNSRGGLISATLSAFIQFLYEMQNLLQRASDNSSLSFHHPNTHAAVSHPR